MQPLSALVGNAELRAKDRAEIARNTSPAERLSRGIELYGWRPDARCCWCGDTGRTPISGDYCGCEAGKRTREDDRSMSLARDWERRWATTNVPRRFRDYRLEGSPLPESMIELIRRWLASEPVDSGTNLVISGSTGVGKTGAAVGALYELHQLGVQPLWFVSITTLLDSIRPEGDGGEWIPAQRAAVLLLDDIGTTKGSAFEQERIFALINTRYEQQRPTILTTNVALAALSESIGERTVSRILEQHVMVAVDGPDRRLA